MTNTTYPKASLLQKECRKCKIIKPENGGYRKRKHRDIGGKREVKVLRIRCQKCKGSLGCIYPAGVMRYKWYSRKVEGIFAILDVHQVDEACGNEISEHLGYSIQAETRAAWQATRAFRAEQFEKELKIPSIDVASVDEVKIGYWWIYTVTDTKSQAILDYDVCESRDEEVVRELISNTNPKLIMSDGCQSIAAACSYFNDKPHGRCWFHVIKDVLQEFPKEERELVAMDLRFLYKSDHLNDADFFLSVLFKRYGQEKLSALINAWHQLRLIWIYKAMPLTNNTSEVLYSALWSRSRKRVVKALHRAKDWFIEARFRWNHHIVRGKSPWQRFSGSPSKPWLHMLITPINYSTDF